MPRLIRFVAILTLSTVAGARPAFCADADDKTVYPGQITEQTEFAQIVTAKRRTLEIQGGFTTKKSLESYGKGGWDTSRSFNVGDTIDVEFHMGVKEAPFKLSTKVFPAPEPVLYLIKDGKEFQQVKFTKGAC